MNTKILLTSFDTWLPHHTSNSSDDLLEELSKIDFLPYSLSFLRQLPVNIEKASSLVIDKIHQLQPDVVVCCGMAEKNIKLTIESQATFQQSILKTTVDLENLLLDLSDTTISNDAGKFVCEGLYYSVLQELQTQQLASKSINKNKKNCVFVHVPILTPYNLPVIVEDFRLILQKLALLYAA
ncbi:MAG TPA: peptidase C15 [Oculatellaceae cyanobacterium]|jgi:pyroglutamyl-peptidase